MSSPVIFQITLNHQTVSPSLMFHTSTNSSEILGMVKTTLVSLIRKQRHSKAASDKAKAAAALTLFLLLTLDRKLTQKFYANPGFSEVNSTFFHSPQNCCTVWISACSKSVGAMRSSSAADAKTEHYLSYCYPDAGLK